MPDPNRKAQKLHSCVDPRSTKLRLEDGKGKNESEQHQPNRCMHFAVKFARGVSHYAIAIIQKKKKKMEAKVPKNKDGSWTEVRGKKKIL